jgi:hypothetical protein
MVFLFFFKCLLVLFGDFLLLILALVDHSKHGKYQSFLILGLLKDSVISTFEM